MNPTKKPLYHMNNSNVASSSMIKLHINTKRTTAFNKTRSKLVKSLFYFCLKNPTLNEDKTMFIWHSFNKTFPKLNSIVKHNCTDSKTSNRNTCKRLKKTLKIRYLGIILDNNLRWNLHLHNVVENYAQ